MSCHGDITFAPSLKNTRNSVVPALPSALEVMARVIKFTPLRENFMFELMSPLNAVELVKSIKAEAKKETSRII